VRPEGSWTAMNDVSVHRKPGHRVADLAYGLAGEEIGRVRCDGLVVASPQGSTGYNLANGGPVMAWGVEGYVVSFVAPHSLTARALVIAPGDLLTINNASREEPVEVHVDGRPTCELPPGEDLHVEFVRDQGTLAQLPGASFYHRLRERFGRLARRGAHSSRAVRHNSVTLCHRTAESRPIRRLPLIHPAACFTSCASRTCC
jgi:NAD+ kinase